MNRRIAVLALGVLGVIAAGCAAAPAEVTKPTSATESPTSQATANAANPGKPIIGGVDPQRTYGTEDVGTCKTPTGASAEAPATCESGCVWSTTSFQCVMADSGVIVQGRKPTEH